MPGCRGGGVCLESCASSPHELAIWIQSASSRWFAVVDLAPDRETISSRFSSTVTWVRSPARCTLPPPQPLHFRRNRSRANRRACFEHVGRAAPGHANTIQMGNGGWQFRRSATLKASLKAGALRLSNGRTAIDEIGVCRCERPEKTIPPGPTWQPPSQLPEPDLRGALGRLLVSPVSSRLAKSPFSGSLARSCRFRLELALGRSLSLARKLDSAPQEKAAGGVWAKSSGASPFCFG